MPTSGGLSGGSAGATSLKTVLFFSRSTVLGVEVHGQMCVVVYFTVVKFVVFTVDSELVLEFMVN